MTGRKSLAERVRERAVAIHRRNGHPEGYEGPCWGPTEDEVEQATREVMRSEEAKP